MTPMTNALSMGQALLVVAAMGSHRRMVLPWVVRRRCKHSFALSNGARLNICFRELTEVSPNPDRARYWAKSL